MNLPSSGIQNEIDLGSLLDKADAIKIFDPAATFDLRSLLTEKGGVNLRNELAHGLIDLGEREAEFTYLWWVVLRCVVAPLLAISPEGGDQRQTPVPQG